MPLWCSIAYHGGTNFDEFKKLRNMENRLEKIIHKLEKQAEKNLLIPHNVDDESRQLTKNDSNSCDSFGRKMLRSTNNNYEQDYQDLEPPSVKDFLLAITYILVGIISLTAGIFSIQNQIID